MRKTITPRFSNRHHFTSIPFHHHFHFIAIRWFGICWCRSHCRLMTTVERCAAGGRRRWFVLHACCRRHADATARRRCNAAARRHTPRRTPRHYHAAPIRITRFVQILRVDINANTYTCLPFLLMMMPRWTTPSESADAARCRADDDACRFKDQMTRAPAILNRNNWILSKHR